MDEESEFLLTSQQQWGKREGHRAAQDSEGKGPCADVFVALLPPSRPAPHGTESSPERSFCLGGLPRVGDRECEI